MARSRRSRLGDITDRGLIAYNCGARMHAAGMDYVTESINADIDMRPLLTDDEKDAYDQSSPSVWRVQWWRGWNDAAEKDLSKGEGR